MPVTTTNKFYYAAPASNLALMFALVEMLCGEHATVTSTTDWTVIDSWDGTTRTAPVSGDLADCANAWVPGGGAPGANSWIVLASQPGRVAANFQVKFTVVGSTAQIQLIPYADWTVGGGTGASPTIPSRICAQASTDISTATQPRAIVWDEAMFAVMSLNTAGASQAQMYVGELEARASEAEDPRPFVQFASSSGWTASSWSRISPINDTTLLTTASVMIDATTLGSTTYPIGFYVAPVPLFFSAASHQHFAGTARHIGLGPQVTTNSRRTFGLTLGVRDWVFFRPTGNSYGMLHDGTTLDADEVRMRESYDTEAPTGYPLVRARPQLVRIR